MQVAKVLNLIALALIAAAAAADYTLPRLAVPGPQALAVESFPRQIAGWQAGADRPVDPQIADRLSSATVVERDYRSPDGRDIDLMLVTADRDRDIHDPALCLPAQGWDISGQHALRLGRQVVNEVDIEQGAQRYVALFWFAAYRRPIQTSSPILAALLQARRRVVGDREGASLLVRLVADRRDRKVLEGFAAEIMPDIQSLRRGESPRQKVSLAGKS